MSDTKKHLKRVLKTTPFSKQVELIEKSIIKNSEARSSNQYNNSGRFPGQQEFAGDVRKNLLQLKNQHPLHNLLHYQQQQQQLQGHHHNHQNLQPQLYYKNEDNYQKQSRQRHQHLQQQIQHQLLVTYPDVNEFSLASLLISENSPHMNSYDYKNMFMMVNDNSNQSVNSPAMQPQGAIQLSQSSSNGFFSDSGSPAGQNLLAFPAPTNVTTGNSSPSILPSLGNGGVSNPSGTFLNSSPSLLPTTSIGETGWISSQMGQGNATSSIWGPNSFQKDLIGTFGDNNSSAVSGSYNSTVSGNYGSRMW